MDNTNPTSSRRFYQVEKTPSRKQLVEAVETILVGHVNRDSIQFSKLFDLALRFLIMNYHQVQRINPDWADDPDLLMARIAEIIGTP